MTGNKAYDFYTAMKLMQGIFLCNAIKLRPGTAEG